MAGLTRKEWIKRGIMHLDEAVDCFGAALAMTAVGKYRTFPLPLTRDRVARVERISNELEHAWAQVWRDRG